MYWQRQRGSVLVETEELCTGRDRGVLYMVETEEFCTGRDRGVLYW